MRPRNAVRTVRTVRTLHRPSHPVFPFPPPSSTSAFPWLGSPQGRRDATGANLYWQFRTKKKTEETMEDTGGQTRRSRARSGALFLVLYLRPLRRAAQVRAAHTDTRPGRVV
jgi:hypothetical protein